MENPPSRLLKPAVVEDRTTLDRITIWRKVRDGSFPQPIKISERRIAWREADVEAWITSCAPPAAGDMAGVA
jgi:prophage regulatory protein